MIGLSYPERWPLRSFSPPVEDVQDAYDRGEISDNDLSHELEWARSHPEPPASVYFIPDEALIIPQPPDVLPESINALAEDETNSVAVDCSGILDREFDDGGNVDVTRQVSITCAPSELELVLESLADMGDR